MPLRKQQSAGKPPSNSPQASFFKNPFKKGSDVISDDKAPSWTKSFFHRLKRSNTVRPRLSKKAVKGFTQAAASPSQIDNELTTSSTSRGDFSPSSGLDAHKSSSHPPPPASPISDATEDTSSPGQQPSSATDLSLDTKDAPSFSGIFAKRLAQPIDLLSMINNSEADRAISDSSSPPSTPSKPTSCSFNTTEDEKEAFFTFYDGKMKAAVRELVNHYESEVSASKTAQADQADASAKTEKDAIFKKESFQVVADEYLTGLTLLNEAAIAANDTPPTSTPSVTPADSHVIHQTHTAPFSGTSPLFTFDGFATDVFAHVDAPSEAQLDDSRDLETPERPAPVVESTLRHRYEARKRAEGRLALQSSPDLVDGVDDVDIGSSGLSAMKSEDLGFGPSLLDLWASNAGLTHADPDSGLQHEVRAAQVEDAVHIPTASSIYSSESPEDFSQEYDSLIASNPWASDSKSAELLPQPLSIAGVLGPESTSQDQDGPNDQLQEGEKEGDKEFLDGEGNGSDEDDVSTAAFPPKDFSGLRVDRALPDQGGVTGGEVDIAKEAAEEETMEDQIAAGVHVEEDLSEEDEEEEDDEEEDGSDDDDESDSDDDDDTPISPTAFKIHDLTHEVNTLTLLLSHRENTIAVLNDDNAKLTKTLHDAFSESEIRAKRLLKALFHSRFDGIQREQFTEALQGDGLRGAKEFIEDDYAQLVRLVRVGAQEMQEAKVERDELEEENERLNEQEELAGLLWEFLGHVWLLIGGVVERMVGLEGECEGLRHVVDVMELD